MKAKKGNFFDAKLSEEEIREAFEQCDEKESGLISIKKLKIVMRALGFEPRQAEIDELVKQILKNGSAGEKIESKKDTFSLGDLTSVLRMKMSSDVSESEINSEIQSTFRLFDTDGKGFINLGDLRRVAAELGEEIDDAELKEMLEEADVTKKGQVTETDFKMKRRRCFTIANKLNVIEYAQQHSISAASKKFNIDRKRVREWTKQKEDLSVVVKIGELKRLPGAGRHLSDKELDLKLLNWIFEECSKNKRVTRRLIQLEAQKLAFNLTDDKRNEFKASNGWLEKFLKRHNLTIRRSTKANVTDLFMWPLENMADSFETGGSSNSYFDALVDDKIRCFKPEEEPIPT